ncbi:MAG TPA: ferrochelatase [Kineosporiaceae bacterium]|nr:ferrochelatase [Kineosporiaceae bacterium]
MTVPAVAPYDAVLLLSFGGPEQPADVLPFLENVTRGRGIPRERLESVAEHYHHFGGRSPINDQNRALLAALRSELDARGLGVPLYWGNRNWDPYLLDTLRQARADGVRRLCVIVTSAYSSYSGCRQYREDLAAALIGVAEEAGGDQADQLPEVDKIRHYFNHPGFVAANADAVLAALARVPEGSRIAFVTHSVPTAMNDTAGIEGGRYESQHRHVAAAVTGAVGEQVGERIGTTPEWDLVYCSRSGPPSQPWLEPDVNDHLRALRDAGVPGVVVAPIGFISDHMEVAFDLDTEARETAEEIGLPFVRAATVGTDPRFVAGLVDLVLERAAQARGEEPDQPTAGEAGASWAVCPVGCCRNLRGDKPAACGEDWVGPLGTAARATATSR